MTKQIINQWKWKAKVKSQSISVDMDGTTQAVNIQEATNKVKRKIASQLGVNWVRTYPKTLPQGK